MKINELSATLKIQEINCSEEQLNLLNTFMNVTLETNEKFNLTAITNEDEFVEKMIYDSALALYDLDLSEKSIIDVGTGAGFPGMVLKILEPKAKVTLLDSTAKKINHLLSFAKEQNIKVEGIAARAEDYARNNREKFDYATARAVSQLNILLELIMTGFNSDLNNLFKNYQQEQKYNQYKKASAKDKKNYSKWKTLDFNNDGKITKSDIDKISENKKTLFQNEKLFDYKSNYRLF